MTEIWEAYDEFASTIRWKEHMDTIGDPFYNYDPLSNKPIDLLRRKLRHKLKKKRPIITQGNFTSIHKDADTEEYLSNIQSHLKKLYHLRGIKTPHILSKNESLQLNTILHNLKHNTQIIIKPADKNLGPTIMDRAWYIEAGELFLNSNSYKPLQTFNINIIRNELIEILISSGHINLKLKNTNFLNTEWCHKPLKRLCAEHFHSITSLARTLLQPFLYPDEIAVCPEYFLPKIHKLTTPLPRPPPLILGKLPIRPICASITWPTYATSVFIDILLKPFMLKLPTYIKNSSCVIKLMETHRLPHNCAFLAADVDNLYPSIDINKALSAIEELLTKAAVPADQKLFIIKLTRWVLTNNILEFNDKLYLQIKGTAMGTPCAVVVACIFMGSVENKVLSLTTQINPKPLWTFRFIDDYLIICKTLEDCQVILNLLNTQDSSISLSGVISDHQAIFLDILLYKGHRFNHTGYIDSDLYQKPINRFLYLPFNSHHAPHVSIGWVHSDISRIRLIVSDDRNFNNRIEQFHEQLAARGFPLEVLNKLFHFQPNRQNLIKKLLFTPKNTVNEYPPTVFKIRQSPRTNFLLRFIKRALTVLPHTLSNRSLKRQLRNRHRPIICIKNSKNIHQQTITAKILPPLHPSSR